MEFEQNIAVGCEVRSSDMLVDFLRNSLGLTGVKYMCREGGCGACIVAVSKDGKPPHAVNSCLVPIALCKDWDVTTIEGIGNRKTGYHAIQKTLAEHNGTQCGHCSPGFVMSMYSLLQNKPKITMLEIEQSLSSNICRCTGYRPILEAFKTFASDSPKNNLLDIEELHICKKDGKKCAKNCDEEWCLINKNELNDKIIEMYLKDDRIWFKVNTVEDVFKVLSKIVNDNYMMIAGGTAKGVYPMEENPPIIIDINDMPELKGFIIDQNLTIGAGTTLTELLNIFENVNDTDGFAYLSDLFNHLKKVAHPAVRNVGTIAGNLMIKNQHNEFPSDIYLMLELVGGMVTIQRRYVQKETISMEQFLHRNMKGYIILNVILPPLGSDYKMITFKIMPRSQNSHCINAGFLIRLNQNNIVISSRIVYGGLSSSFQRAKATESYLTGRSLFKNDTVQGAIKVLEREIIVDKIPGELTAEYRGKLAVAVFYKGLLSLCPDHLLNARYRSGAQKIHDTRPVSTATQVYDTDKSQWPINQPLPKAEGLIQCAGETEYTEDLPPQPQEVFAAFLLATVGLGTIVSIDTSDALNYPGVLAVYTAKDIPGINNFLSPDPLVIKPEETFCSGEVKYFNQPYGVIVAETRHIADVAAKLVKVKYANVKTPVTDVREASKDPKRTKMFLKVDETQRGSNVAKVIKGNDTTGRQYHFAMETIACVSLPTEEGFKVLCTTQWIDGVQYAVAKALNIEENRVDVHVRRLGGAFGYKISRPNRVAVACALVAYKLNRPCRIIQSLTTNTRSFGKRTIGFSNYEETVSSTGEIQYMNYELFLDDGYVDSEMVILLGGESYFNCYDRSRWNFKNYNCLTDTPKNSWLRAPSTFEHNVLIELIMEHIAYELALDPFDVRLANVDKTKYGFIEDMIKELREKADYDFRKQAVRAYNQENRWVKKGLGVSILRWTSLPLVGLEVNLSVFHGDGTVIITHGGIEIGQGINTKALQICARLLNIDINQIQIKESNSIIAPNSMYTAASITSQNAGIGVRKCCEELLKRLEPIRATMDNPSWPDLITKAFENKVDLQVHYNVTTNDYVESIYYGVGLVEVKVDILTGQKEILRVDLSQDIGRSVNPVIDIGQIEGAFVMGQGIWSVEDMVYHPSGELQTDRTWNYFVPQATDIAQDFRVYLRKNTFSVPEIFGAKCVGEPPFLLAVAVAHAIRMAIASARFDGGISLTDYFSTVGAFTIEKTFLLSKTKNEHYKLNSLGEPKCVCMSGNVRPTKYYYN